jgi:hypothetical protein
MAAPAKTTSAPAASTTRTKTAPRSPRGRERFEALGDALAELLKLGALMLFAARTRVRLAQRASRCLSLDTQR